MQNLKVYVVLLARYFPYLFQMLFLSQKDYYSPKLKWPRPSIPLETIANESWYTVSYAFFVGIRLHAFWSTWHERLVRFV